MPRIKYQVEGERAAPKKGHLAAMLDTDGMFTALEPGTVMVIVEDSTRADKFVTVVLKSVSLKEIQFQCACGQKDCSLVYVAPLSRKGWHNDLRARQNVIKPHGH